MKLFETEKDGDVTKKWFANEDGDVVIQTTQDVNPTLERNKFILDTTNGWVSEEEEFRQVASIPISVVKIWRDQGIDINDPNDLPKILAMLDTNEYQLLRTSEGKIV